MVMTEQALIAALTPEQRVGLTLWGEARGQTGDLDHDGIGDLIEGIASAIDNRVRARKPRWGLTPDEVCLARAQFSCWSPLEGAENHACVMAAATHLVRGEKGGPILGHCLDVARQVCASTWLDRVNQATHYYSPRAMVPAGRVPDWAVGLTPAATIDGTLFFAGVK